MRLGLHVLPLALDQYLHNLGDIAVNSATLVFLDTNILGYLYKLHAAARKEFFDWATELDLADGRLFIPAWSANEYLAKFKSGKFSEYAPSRPAQVSKSLISLRETASLFVDDDSLKKINFHGTRDDFLAGFDTAIKELEKFTSVFSQQFDTWSVHNEITSILSNSILHSDLALLCSRATAEGDARIAHRLPPGYKDSSKTENKYGDLIIWYEILEQSKKNARTNSPPGGEVPRSVLFVTNDEKPDWVYAPEKRLMETKGVKSQIRNVDPVIRLPDPRLLAEFRATVGHDKMYITTLPMLIRALSTVRPKGLEYLSSAIQIEARDLSETSEPGIEFPSLVSDGPNLPPMVAQTAAADASLGSRKDRDNHVTTLNNNFSGVVYPADALRDGAYEADAPGKINEIIRSLRSGNWYVQNPAIQEIKELRRKPFKPGQWFVLGRNIYQAACGNAQRALEFLKNLDIELSRFPQETACHILSGMAFEVYFDRDGNFRDKPKATHIEQIMREISNDLYQKSRSTLLAQLGPYDSWIPFKPGDTDPLPLDIEVIEKEVEEAGVSRMEIIIHSVRFLGEERLSVDQDEDQSLRTSFFRGKATTTTAKLIKSELSDNYAIPEWAIHTQLNIPGYADNKLVIPKGKVLKLDRPPLTLHNQ